MARNDQPVRARRHSTAGFTLVEVMVASFISISMLGGLIAIQYQQQIVHNAQRQMTEIRQNTGFAMDCVLRDIRMAGYGLQVPPLELDTWVHWIDDFTTNPKIIEGANGAPDKLVLIAAWDSPVAVLASGSVTGDTSLAVSQLDTTPNLFNTNNRKIIFINKTETARITGISGSGSNLVLQISTHPTQNAGIHRSYPAGSQIELVLGVTYEWKPANTSSSISHPYLTRRDEATADEPGGLWEVSANCIEDFQVVPTGQERELKVEITGISPDVDGRYVDPNYGDHFRRRTLRAIATPRN